MIASSKYRVHQLSTYSNLASWLVNHPSVKMPASQWLNTIGALKNIGQDELGYLGVIDYLNRVGTDRKVLKAELIGVVVYHLSNFMQLQLVTRQLAQYQPSIRLKSFSQDLLPKKILKLLANTIVLDCFKFSSFNYRIIKYRFDGGWFGSIDRCIVFDNKWERLKPQKSYTMLGAIDYIYSVISNKFKAFKSSFDDVIYEEYSTLGKNSRYQEWLLSLPYWPNAFKEGHFDLNNVLLHIRTSEWHDENGNQLLLIDELQSDWHARGREFGYYKFDEQRKNDQVPCVAFQKEWVALGVRVALTIAVQKGIKQISFVDSTVQGQRYGELLDGFVKLYDQQIPNYLSKLAKQFQCDLNTTSIIVSKPRYNIRYKTKQEWLLQSIDKKTEIASVMNYPVAMLFVKNKGQREIREINVMKINNDLSESIKLQGIPLYGSFKQ